MAKTMFPDLETPSVQDLIGLKIVSVKESLHGSVKSIQCVNERGELYEISFRQVEGSFISVNLDNQVITNIEMEVDLGKNH